MGSVTGGQNDIGGGGYLRPRALGKIKAVRLTKPVRSKKTVRVNSMPQTAARAVSIASTEGDCITCCHYPLKMPPLEKLQHARDTFGSHSSRK